MSRKRGLNLQNALAKYLRGQGWPSAESAGAGRSGTDILGTPGVVWENKTADEWDVLAWVRQAKAHSRINNGPHRNAVDLVLDIPVVVYWPRGVGEESVESTLSIVPTGIIIRLLREAGYGAELGQ